MLFKRVMNSNLGEQTRLERSKRIEGIIRLSGQLIVKTAAQILATKTIRFRQE